MSRTRTRTRSSPYCDGRPAVAVLAVFSSPSSLLFSFLFFSFVSCLVLSCLVDTTPSLFLLNCLCSLGASVDVNASHDCPKHGGRGTVDGERIAAAHGPCCGAFHISQHTAHHAWTAH
ncbi:hypothetical protein CALCODRAFT_327780 [Calocera cornea HHB12733]|uniref:Uncharacterized protein n=1 Tax=Calocera cornea HHB12733 TaxID=1353952 RepID=A0A165JH39_9BASI|nr:hypothetical protein CALCODRAFT_327780 [Calocera cornea HHB12733]